MINTEISPDVAALVEALVAVSPGQRIAYTALDEVIGRDVRAVGWLLQRARHVAARDHGAIFGTEKGVGLQRLTADEYHQIGATVRASIRRRTRAASKTMMAGAARANQISPEAQRKLNAELSTLGLMNEIARDKSAKPTQTHDERPEPVAVIAQRLFPGLKSSEAA